jgi:hypothetical protein
MRESVGRNGQRIAQPPGRAEAHRWCGLMSPNFSPQTVRVLVVSLAGWPSPYCWLVVVGAVVCGAGSLAGGSGRF